MAKITLENGMVIEGTIEEFREMGVQFPVEDGKAEDEGKFSYKPGDKVRGKLTGTIYMLVKRDPSRDGRRNGRAWITDRSVYGYIGENQFELIEEEAPTPLKVGDYAKVLGGADYVNVGDLVELTKAGGFYDFIVKRVSDDKEDAFNSANLVRATDEEVAKAKAAAKPKLKYAEGDYVKTEDGTIAKVTEVDEDDSYQPYKFEALKGSYIGWKKSDYAREKATQEDVKWARIGRKPNEYKEGDIVRVKNPCSAPLKSGQLVEVRLDSDEPLSVNVEGDWLVTVTELVTPVEARVDLP